ncbi:MAG TPA: GTP-binding protein [Candidatus Altiarchaeales archaeon]|nr:GTP-binding protein [Candidatus Altiarchaeales archaeon]
MATLEERIKNIEEEIRNTSYNKKSQHHIGKLKAKLAQLREELIVKRSSGGRGGGFAIRKFGDATVGLVGFPSVGKSTLLNKLTDAKSRVGEYEFTTIQVIPGMMKYKGANIQIIDLPGLIEGASIGRGRGREILSMIRNMDLILIMIDVLKIKELEAIERELYNIGIRLDQRPPQITIKKKATGGIHIISSAKLRRIDERMIKDILTEYKIHSADVTIQEDISEDQLIDAIIGNRIYIPSIVVLNKIDFVDEDELKRISRELDREYIAISANNGVNLDELKEEIFKRLDIIRVYMKPPGKEADMNEPLIMKRGSTIEDICNRLHKGFREKFKVAKIWGKSARFDGQPVGLSHVVNDRDIVTIITAK